MPDNQSSNNPAARVLDRFEEIALVALVSLVVIVSFLDVIVRAVNVPLSYVQQILPNVFVWIVWIGIPFAIRRREHFRIRILPDRIQTRFKVQLKWLGAVVAAVFFLVTTVFGVISTATSIRFGNMTPSGFPAAILDLAVPVGSVLAIIRIVQLALGGEGDDPGKAVDRGIESGVAGNGATR